MQSLRRSASDWCADLKLRSTEVMPTTPDIQCSHRNFSSLHGIHQTASSAGEAIGAHHVRFSASQPGSLKNGLACSLPIH